jgi:tripartite ATP-independent transporter DctP family solute receptor
MRRLAMKHNVFLSGCMVGLLSIGLFLIPGLSLGAPITLKLAHVAPPNTTYDNAALKLAEGVAKYTKGKVEIKIYGSAQLGGEGQQFAQLKAGAIDMVLSDYFAAAMLEPEPKNFFVNLVPYLFKSMNHFHKYLKSDLFRTTMARAEEAGNIKFVGYLGDRSPRMLTTSKTKVITPADCKGVKLRVPPVPVYVETWKRWGATPTPVAAKDIYTSLKTGLVDGQDQTILAIWDAKYYEVQKYGMILDHILDGMGTWINRDKWNSFDPETQAAFLKAAQETDAFMSKQVETLTPAAIKNLEKAGVIIVKPDIAAFKAIAEKWPLEYDGKWWEKGLYEKIRALD